MTCPTREVVGLLFALSYQVFYSLSYLLDAGQVNALVPLAYQTLWSGAPMTTKELYGTGNDGS